MAGLRLGSATPSAYKVGSVSAARLYLGSNLLYPADAPPAPVAPTPHFSFSSATRISTAANYQGFPAITKATNGDLVATWRKATTHATTTDGEIMLSRSSNDGATWSTPVQIVKLTSKDARDPGMIRLADGRLMMQFFRHAAEACMVTYSSDNGVTWTTPVDLPFTSATTVACSGPPVQLPNGDIIVVGYGGSTTNWSVWMMRSTDNGVTWDAQNTLANGATDARQYSEPNIGLLPDGSLLVFIRCDTNGFVYRRRSTDGGVTWSSMTATSWTGGGRPAWFAAGENTVVMLNRNGVGGTTNQYMISRDAGVTWLLEWHPINTGTLAAYAAIVKISDTLMGMVIAQEGGTQVGINFILIDVLPGSANIVWADTIDRQATWPVTNWTTVATGALTTATKTGTGKALQSNAGAQAIVLKSNMQNLVSRSFGFDFRIAALPAAENYIAGFGRSDGAGAGAVSTYLRITPTGQLKMVYRTITTVFGTSAAGTIVAGQHHRIDVLIGTGLSGTGSVVVYVDNVQVIFATGITVDSANGTSLGVMWLYSHAGNVTFDYPVITNNGSRAILG